MSTTPANPCVEQSAFRARDVLAVALFLAVLGPMAWRLYEHWPQEDAVATDQWALASYRDATYYPLLAVRDGVNPYDVVRNDDPSRYMQRYPVRDTFPLYSPLILLVFAPFAALPVLTSMAAFAVFNVLLFLLLSVVTLKTIGRRADVAGVFFLTALLLASQPGRAAFNSGQIALPLALATIGALQWGDRRPLLSALLVGLTTMKVTYGGPLSLLLAARRDWRSAIGGLALGGALGALGLVIVFGRSGDLTPQRIVEVLTTNQSDFNTDPTVVPETNKARIDLVSSLEYLTDRRLAGWFTPLVGAAVLGLTSWVIWHQNRMAAVPSAGSTTSALIILAMYLCIYHNMYDLPLLVLPIAACVTRADDSWQRLASGWRWFVVFLLLVPFVNVFWTEGFRTLLGRLGMAWGPSAGVVSDLVYRGCCAANGLALFAAWAIVGVCLGRDAWRASHRLELQKVTI